MRPWKDLNLQGKLVLLTCVLNACLAVFLATNGGWFSIPILFCAMLGGIATYSQKYNK